MSKGHNQYFQNWYASNRQRISEQRKLRYEQDPEYRRKVLERSAARRRKHAVQVPSDCVSVATAAHMLEVSEFVLRRWMQHEYMPPLQKFGSQAFLTQQQVGLLVPLRDFLRGRRRLSASEKVRLDGILILISANWV